jgi:Fe-S cluster assembly iron-binding protein IscA|tara:strand:+ start:482 stop:829 length:348 start_codon:yes stop_codon:yes gene_type:complete
MDNKFRRFQESEGIPHIIRLTSDAQWEVINEFKKKGGPRYCILHKCPNKYEYYFSFTSKRNPFDWLMDVKGPKMPRWLIVDEIYQEIKFKTLDIKEDIHGKRLLIRNPDNYKELK